MARSAWRAGRGGSQRRGGAAMQPLPGARAALALRVPAPCRMVARHAKGDSTRMTGWMRRRLRGSRHRAVRTLLALARRLQGGDADALARMLHESQPLGADTLVRAYACGLLRLARGAARRVLWRDRPVRGGWPVDGVRRGRGARRLGRQGRFAVAGDAAFDQVVAHCAHRRGRRHDTWISDGLMRAYAELHRIG